jgi:hypothetical protein
MRVNHFQDHKYGRLNIEKRRLKIARWDTLNDPFESLPASASKKDRAFLFDLRRRLNASSGLLCFSRDLSNPVQWSHYADRHFGICLGFDVATDAVRSVTYPKTRQRVDLAKLFTERTQGEKLLAEYMGSKAADWAYENEVRMDCTLDNEEKGLFFFPFGDDLRLREVIVGHRCPMARDEVIAVLGDLAPTVEITKARLAFNTFKIVRQRRAGLW